MARAIKAPAGKSAAPQSPSELADAALLTAFTGGEKTSRHAGGAAQRQHSATVSDSASTSRAGAKPRAACRDGACQNVSRHRAGARRPAAAWQRFSGQAGFRFAGRRLRAVSVSVAHTSTKLGLDLQGGVNLVLQVRRALFSLTPSIRNWPTPTRATPSPRKSATRCAAPVKTWTKPMSILATPARRSKCARRPKTKRSSTRKPPPSRARWRAFPARSSSPAANRSFTFRSRTPIRRKTILQRRRKLRRRTARPHRGDRALARRQTRRQRAADSIAAARPNHRAACPASAIRSAPSKSSARRRKWKSVCWRPA